MLKSFAREVIGLYKRGRHAVGLIRKRRPLLPGLPKGVEWEEVDALCLEVKGHPLQAARHWHISGWKDSGAFRLLLALQGGGLWTVVYKDAFYGEDQLPAMQGFPGLAGPPEYTVYTHTDGPVCRYLPEVYQATEVEANRHYRYLLEDLRGDYQLLYGKEGVDAIVQHLPSLHRSLAEWGTYGELPGFIRYDAAFTDRMQVYLLDSLEKFVARYPLESMQRFLEQWPTICQVYSSPGFDLEDGLQAIHGDLNLRNVLFGRKNRNRFKLLDWEWAGWGQPHADLASVLKHLPASTCQQAVETYAALDTRLSLAEHERRFYWHRLQRGLMDAAFMAKQVLESPPQTSMNVFNFLDNSISQAVDSYKRLAAAPAREL